MSKKFFVAFDDAPRFLALAQNDVQHTEVWFHRSETLMRNAIRDGKDISSVSRALTDDRAAYRHAVERRDAILADFTAHTLEHCHDSSDCYFCVRIEDI